MVEVVLRCDQVLDLMVVVVIAWVPLEPVVVVDLVVVEVVDRWIVPWKNLVQACRCRQDQCQASMVVVVVEKDRTVV